jgi:hypothetical protein
VVRDTRIVMYINIYIYFNHNTSHATAPSFRTIPQQRRILVGKEPFRDPVPWKDYGTSIDLFLLFHDQSTFLSIYYILQLYYLDP